MYYIKPLLNVNVQINLGSGHYFIIYGGVGKCEGGKRSFILINRGGQKSFNAEKGEVKKVFELKYHVQSSDFYNHK